LSVPWPVDDSGKHVAVELSGLPIFDRDRHFRGYRGFGICRERVRLDTLAAARAAAPAIAARAASAPADDLRPTARGTAPKEKVGALRAHVAEAGAPNLSAVELRAFEELARRLSDRLTDVARADSAEPATADQAERPEDHLDADLINLG